MTARYPRIETLNISEYGIRNYLLFEAFRGPNSLGEIIANKSPNEFKEWFNEICKKTDMHGHIDFVVLVQNLHDEKLESLDLLGDIVKHPVVGINKIKNIVYLISKLQAEKRNRYVKMLLSHSELSLEMRSKLEMGRRSSSRNRKSRQSRKSRHRST